VTTDNQIPRSIAVWALSETGTELAGKLIRHFSEATVFLPRTIQTSDGSIRRFERLSEAVDAHFKAFDGHIFIMSTGIVVRMIAKQIQHKTTDPAVVVMDEIGNHVISLLSGHLGGANALANLLSTITGADPVITTATDVHHLPAIDLLAKAHGLIIENPEAIKWINMAILEGRGIYLRDPFNVLGSKTDDIQWLPWGDFKPAIDSAALGVYIDDRQAVLPEHTLVLRPKTLTAGIGCNKGTDPAEIMGLLKEVLMAHRLAQSSLSIIASIDLKREEPGILRIAQDLGCRTIFYTKDELNRVDGISSPSAVVKKYTGAKSVCEAAAIIASSMGTMVVPKQKTRNVTVAIARRPCTSSASAREVWGRCPNGYKIF
jgi:cobalt-precorrin 5A hydrolase